MRWVMSNMPSPLSGDPDSVDGHKTRRADRRPVDQPATLRPHNWYEIAVQLRDVSACGFMVECNQPVLIGSYLSLDLPGIGPVQAQVRWQIGRRMGGMFLDPISLSRCEWTAEKIESSAPAEND
jgi:hypothetical protein